MADTERALVWSAIQTGKLDDVLSEGIEPHHFADEEVADVYDWAWQYAVEYGQQPTSEALETEFPEFKARLSKEPTKYHIKKFLVDVKQRKAEDGLRAFFDLLEDPDEVADIEVHALDFAQQLVEVVPAPRASYFGRDAKKRRQQYDKRKKDGITHGLMMGIPTYDRMMLGMQPHELIVFAAPPGVGKTTGMQAVSWHVYIADKKILFISLEVEEEQIQRKFDVIASNVSYHAMKALELEVGEEKKWHDILERAEKSADDREIIVRGDIKNCSVERVATETMRYKPDLVVVDYLEEMRTRKGMDDWQSVRDNARGLKQQARTLRIPHLTATQINRDGETAHQSIHKVADTLIQLVPDEDREARGEMLYRLHKYRDGPSRKEVVMRWLLERMDIGEKGVSETFKPRDKTIGKSLSKRERLKEQRLNVATAVRGQSGADNPWVRQAAGRTNGSNGKASLAGLQRIREERGVVHSQRRRMGNRP